jgi:hypothetical protein
MNSTKLLCAVGICAGALMPLASTADAAFRVTSPGTMCVEDNDVTPSIRYSFGNAFNSNTVAEIFNCPMTVYNPTAVSFFGEVIVNDQSTTAGFSCAIRACNATGTSCSVSNTFTTGAAFTGILGSAFLGASGSQNGYSYMRCTVPGGNTSNIISFNWLE